MGKTRGLFKKIRDTKGTFHAKMGSIKDGNGMDLTEAEDIKRWQEYTEELYQKRKKDLNDPIRLPTVFFRELEQIISQFVWKYKKKTSNRQNNLEKEEWNWRNQPA